MMIDNEAAIKVLRDINKTFADAGIVPYYNGPPTCKECDELQLKLQEARKQANELATAHGKLVRWNEEIRKGRDEARKLVEDERELRQEAVEAAREMSRQIDRHDSKLAEIERERDEARKLAEELRDAWRDIARVQQYANMRKLALPWEEK
jgi:DNA repair exonuclease SbcCD ATPase subunit